MNPLLILTREDRADDRLAVEAEAMGFTVVRRALLAFEPGADAGDLAHHVSRIPDGTALAWTSRHAAEALARAHPRRVPMYAVGDESAAPLRHAGYEPLVPPEPLGAAELARFIAGRAAQDRIQCVIFLHGNRSLPDLPESLKSAGLDVSFLQVYRTRLLAPDFGGVGDAVLAGVKIVVVYFSPSGVEAFERLLSFDAIATLRRHGVAVARGNTTALALEGRGYRNVLGFESKASFARYAQHPFEVAPEGSR